MTSKDQKVKDLPIRLIFKQNWPNVQNPIDLVSLTLEHSDSSPVIVMDRFGGGEAATFIALSVLMKQLNSDEHLDVYKVVKNIHTKRPGVWKSSQELLSVYNILLTYLEERQ